MSNEVQWRAASIEGFVAASVSFLNSGYRYAWQGRVPEKKSARQVIEKRIRDYGIPTKTWQLKRRNLKAAGVRILEFDRTFVVFLTDLEHDFCDQRPGIIDTTVRPLLVFGYSLKGLDSGVQVRLSPKRYADLKRHFERVSCWKRFRDPAKLERYLMALPVQPYGPVYTQMMSLVHGINRQRKRHGLPTVSPDCLRRFRTIDRYYQDPNSGLDKP